MLITSNDYTQIFGVKVNGVKRWFTPQDAKVSLMHDMHNGPSDTENGPGGFELVGRDGRYEIVNGEPVYVMTREAIPDEAKLHICGWGGGCWVPLYEVLELRLAQNGELEEMLRRHDSHE